MGKTENTLLCGWASNVAQEHGVELWKVIDLFKAVNNITCGMNETRNQVEKGLIEGKRDRCEG